MGIVSFIVCIDGVNGAFPIYKVRIYLLRKGSSKSFVDYDRELEAV